MKKMKFTKMDYYLRLFIYVGFILACMIIGNAMKEVHVYHMIFIVVIGIGIFKWVEDSLDISKKNKKIKIIEDIDIDIPIE